MVSRLVRDIRPYEGMDETLLVLGGMHGAVVLHLDAGGVPTRMILHSPQEMPAWSGPVKCMVMEVPCWCLGSVTGDELALGMAAQDATGNDEPTWALMEEMYRLYLERGRR